MKGFFLNHCNAIFVHSAAHRHFTLKFCSFSFSVFVYSDRLEKLHYFCISCTLGK